MALSRRRLSFVLLALLLVITSRCQPSLCQDDDVNNNSEKAPDNSTDLNLNDPIPATNGSEITVEPDPPTTTVENDITTTEENVPTTTEDGNDSSSNATATTDATIASSTTTPSPPSPTTEERTTMSAGTTITTSTTPPGQETTHLPGEEEVEEEGVPAWALITISVLICFALIFTAMYFLRGYLLKRRRDDQRKLLRSSSSEGFFYGDGSGSGPSNRFHDAI